MKLKHLLLTALLISTSPLAAAYNDSCAPSSDCCESRGSVYVDFLWWKVQRTGLDKSSGSGEDTKIKFLCPDHDFGWRIGGRYHWNCVDFRIQYTSVDDTSSKRFLEASEKERFSYKIDYDVVDIEIGYPLRWCCCNDFATLRPFTGVKFAWIDERFHNINALSEDDKARFDFDGYGLYVGSEFSVPLFCDISLTSRGSFAILDSEFDEKGGEDIKNVEDECLYIGILEAFVGFSYEVSCAGIDSNLLIGYDVQKWDWRQNDSTQNLAHLGLGGLVVRLGASF